MPIAARPLPKRYVICSSDVDRPPRRLADSTAIVTGAGEITGRCRPSLNTPHGIYGDSRGNLFIAEVNPSRITRLARQDE